MDLGKVPQGSLRQLHAAKVSTSDGEAIPAFADSQTRLAHSQAHQNHGSAIFKLALDDEIIVTNPWYQMPMPDDVVKPEGTPHYTREQSEDLVSALVDHVDAQLVLAFACFLALGPAEIAGLRWEDIEQDWIHVRRNVVFGQEGTTKTIERAASLPILDEVRVPLELWREEVRQN